MRYRVILKNKDYYPQFRRVFLWWNFNQAQDECYDPVKFTRRESAMDYIKAVIAQRTRIKNEDECKPAEVVAKFYVR